MPDRFEEARDILLKARTDSQEQNIQLALSNSLSWLDEALNQENDCIIGVYS